MVEVKPLSEFKVIVKQKVQRRGKIVVVKKRVKVENLFNEKVYCPRDDHIRH